MKNYENRNRMRQNAKKPLWTKLVTALLVVIAIDLALLLVDFSQVFIAGQEPRFAQETATEGDNRHYTGLGYSFDIEGTENGEAYVVQKANFNIFGQYLCTTK